MLLSAIFSHSNFNPHTLKNVKQQCAFFRDSGAVALDTLQTFPVELVYTDNNMQWLILRSKCLWQ